MLKYIRIDRPMNVIRVTVATVGNEVKYIVRRTNKILQAVIG